MTKPKHLKTQRWFILGTHFSLAVITGSGNISGMADPFSSIFKTGCVAWDGKAILSNSINTTIANPMNLMEYDGSMGDGTVFIDEKTDLLFYNWPSNAQKFTSLFESPEFFGRKYKRGRSTVIFIGSEHGIIWGHVSEFESHGALMRHFRDHGVEGIGLIGEHPLRLDSETSGAILPKQKGVDATYVSMWCPNIEGVRQYINSLLKVLNVEAPVLYDKNVGEKFLGPWQVVSW